MGQDDPAQRAEMDRLLDEARITRIVAAYFRALDERRFEEADFREVVAPLGRVVRPNGQVTTGPAEIAASHARSFARFAATQHLLAAHAVEIDGDAATDRVDLVAIHLWKDRPADASMADRSFTAGDVVTADLRRTADGWRIVEIGIRVVWRTGFLGDMPATR